MESNRVRLVDFFESSVNTDGIANLYITKLDLYRKQNLFEIRIDGIDELGSPNDLANYYNSIRNRVQADILFVCDSSVVVYNPEFEVYNPNREPLERRFNNLKPYLMLFLKKYQNGTFSFADMMDFELYEDKLIIRYPDYLSVVYNNTVMESLGRKMCELITKSLNTDEITGYRLAVITEEEAELGVPYIPEVPEEPVMEMEVPVAPVQSSIPDEVKKQIQKVVNLAPKPEVVEEKPAEEKVNKDSWAYKAKEQQKTQKQEFKTFKREKNADNAIIGKVRNGVRTVDISTLAVGDGTVNIVGSILADIENMRLAKSGKCVITNFIVLDKTGGVSCLAFIKPEEADTFQKNFKKGGYAGVQGEVSYNKNNEIEIRVSGMFEAKKPSGRVDTAPVKRVELHVHSKMSEKDAVSEPADIMKLAASFGHKACAITDHGVVQAFPACHGAAKGLKVGDTDEKFKSILGCEGYLVDDGPTIIYGLPFEEENIKQIGTFVTLSIRTSGKDHISDTMYSVAASKYRLKGYKQVRPIMEGESDEDAIKFSAVDIDTSLWSVDEIPEELRDENLKGEEIPPREQISKLYNEHMSVAPDFTEEDKDEVPDSIVFEHVADFYAEFEDKKYEGTGEPCESYFAMGELVEFIGDSYIAGGNIFQTLSFLRRAGYGINIEDHKYYRNKFLMPAISVEDIKRYASEVSFDSHFAFEATGNSDADMLLKSCYEDANVVVSYLSGIGSLDPTYLNGLIGHKSVEDIKARKISPAYHVIYLARTNLGLYSLYRCISESHVHYFSMRPRTPKSLLKYYSSGLIVGGACERGEIYRHVLKTYKDCGKDRAATLDNLINSQEMKDIISIYDYVEIQPLCNNMFMTRQDPEKSDTGNVPLNADDIRIVNELLVEVADAYGKPCCATTDSHFLEKEDGMYRKYILMDLGFADAEDQADLYFRTTDEMLEEFSYLGKEKAYEVVVTNTNMIADMIDYGIKPFPDGTYPPIIARAAEDVRNIAYTKANKMYRHNGVLDETVRLRLEKELKSIIGNGFAIMYYIAYRLVKKSNNDGYIVGSRGSVGSSFVATMCGISEVNPLEPHYRCPKCNKTIFDLSGEYGSGYDMPVKDCPECGTRMQKDGQDIPFETFLGFYGDKQPDIDLNFSGDYQPRAHKYVEFLFGTTHTFRAGTIGTYADKNAILVARKACEKMEKPYTNAQLTYMSQGIVGVKRTTSQHPGGIVVVPKEMDVYEFTPIQYPANKTDCGIITTHFDFRAMHDTILKLDILGHADPTVLRMLHEITDINIQGIPIPDDKVMALLKSTDVLGFPEERTDAKSATLGLSELGTNMARGMIKETQPSRFYDLVQLMGLSHGTDVWTGNAQELIKDGICDLNSVIGCRDSIMTRLIYWGLPNKDSFDIMEKVRKGKGLSPEHEGLMKEKGVPDWYIESCKKIKYMFPKAHAAAYSISTLRVAWFKVYYPEEYYCAFFSIRGDEFDADLMCKGEEKVAARRKALAEQMRQDSGNPKLKSEFYLCEIVEEMYARGITFAPITLEDSQASRFVKVEPGVIRPPFDSIDSISSSMAEAICKARSEAPFKNREDFNKRSGVGQSAVQKLLDYGGILDDMPESAQVSLFDLFGGE